MTGTVKCSAPSVSVVPRFEQRMKSLEIPQNRWVDNLRPLMSIWAANTVDALNERDGDSYPKVKELPMQVSRDLWRIEFCQIHLYIFLLRHSWELGDFFQSSIQLMVLPPSVCLLFTVFTTPSFLFALLL